VLTSPQHRVPADCSLLAGGRPSTTVGAPQILSDNSVEKFTGSFTIAADVLAGVLGSCADVLGTHCEEVLGSWAEVLGNCADVRQ
jgi:hypothetical protein